MTTAPHVNPSTTNAARAGIGDPTTARSSDARAAGILALGAVALCAVGAILNQAIVDVDVYAAMETDSAAERARLLGEVAEAQTPLVAGFVVWMIAFPMTAAASILLARLGGRSTLTDVVRQATIASMGAVLVFLPMFITFVVVIAPAHAAGEDVSTLAHAVGFTATTIDWAISAVILGVAPVAAVYAGRDTWAPRWLQGLAGVTAIATVVEVVALVADQRDFLFPLVPIGLLLIGSAGVAALRHAQT